MIESFIPSDLAIAPSPSGLMPNLKLVMIPIDVYIAFEFWLPPQNGTLIPEEVMLLKSDRLRLEEICSRLMWLLGANLLTGETICTPDLIHDWGSLTRLIRQSGRRVDALTIHYSPQRICSDGADDLPNSWTMYPSTWRIAFLELVPIDGRYQAVELPFQLAICFGQPTTRSLTAPVKLG